MSAQDDKHSASCERHTRGLCVCEPAVSAPKPRPSAWDAWCGTCKYRARIESEDHERHYETHMLGCGPVWRPRALWGHEWALVAWLAENEKRKGVLWEYLDSLRNAGGALCVEDELDTLPEDAMQLLCVNL